MARPSAMKSPVLPSDLLERLEQAAPGFRAHAESEENLHSLDTLHGVFSACSSFVSTAAVAPESWQALADLVNSVVGPRDDELANAACTCFLENLASAEHPLRPLLKREALKYWRQWEEGSSVATAKVPKRGLLCAAFRGDLLPPGLYAGAGIVLLLGSPVIAYLVRWGIAKAVSLAVVGAAYLAMARGAQRARRSSSFPTGENVAVRARAVANAAWLIFIALSIAERTTR